METRLIPLQGLKSYSSFSAFLVGTMGDTFSVKFYRDLNMKPFAKSRGRQRQRHMRRAYQKAMREVGQHSERRA